MVVNSIVFFIFFIIVFVLYYTGQKKLLRQQYTLLFANSIFYAWSNWKMLIVLYLSIFLFYILGLSIDKYNKNKKVQNVLCLIGVVIGISLLLYFKYLNFFLDSFFLLFSKIGLEYNYSTFRVLMPIGISFFTFKLISYIIDIRRKEIQPCKNIITLTNYISFFPTILSGPIDKATELLPQFNYVHRFNYRMAVDGCRQILWGMLKKMVIADGFALYTNVNPEIAVGSTLFITSVFYSIQLYFDFSGYSDMAIGVSKLLGFKITPNFRYPYFASSISEFWRRWHISLLNWFRYYIYIPLGGNRCSKIKVIRNTFVIFLISGLWHGPNWTYIFWGLLHAFFFLPTLLNRKPRIKIDIKEKMTLSFNKAINIIKVFLLVNFAWIIFHANNMNQAILTISKIFSLSLFNRPTGVLQSLPILILSLVIFVYEWKASNHEYALKLLPNKKILRWLIYILIVIIIIFYQGKSAQFIYFNF